MQCGTFRSVFPFSLWTCAKGVAAIEFALIAPVLILLYVGSFQFADAIAASRKVTITTRALADLASQYTTINSAGAETILKASSQVMVPYGASDGTFMVSVVKTDAKGVSKISWSRKFVSGAVTTGYAAGSAFSVSGSIAAPGTSIVVAEVSYAYKPMIAPTMFGQFVLSDRIYMLPRRSTDIPFS